MKLKRPLCTFLACATVMSCLIAPANATQIYSDVIRLQDMEYESIDLSVILCREEVMLRSIGAINADIPMHSIRCVTQSIDFKVDDLITFNCSYSPSSASMDFGVIASNGRFYYINVKEGSINQIIKISQSGSYTVAIRNNSSQTVSVVGFVNY